MLPLPKQSKKHQLNDKACLTQNLNTVGKSMCWHLSYTCQIHLLFSSISVINSFITFLFNPNSAQPILIRERRKRKGKEKKEKKMAQPWLNRIHQESKGEK
jgi:hypothetical protein